MLSQGSLVIEHLLPEYVLVPPVQVKPPDQRTGLSGSRPAKKSEIATTIKTLSQNAVNM
jgi:hypothetical protein